MKWPHRHRYIWGEPYNERWTRAADWRDLYAHGFALNSEPAPTRVSYTRTFQLGVCSCGDTKRRELT